MRCESSLFVMEDASADQATKNKPTRPRPRTTAFIGAQKHVPPQAVGHVNAKWLNARAHISDCRPDRLERQRRALTRSATRAPEPASAANRSRRRTEKSLRLRSARRIGRLSYTAQCRTHPVGRWADAEPVAASRRKYASRHVGRQFPWGVHGDKTLPIVLAHAEALTRGAVTPRRRAHNLGAPSMLINRWR